MCIFMNDPTSPNGHRIATAEEAEEFYKIMAKRDEGKPICDRLKEAMQIILDYNSAKEKEGWN